MHSLDILVPNILRGELNIKHGGADVSVSHESLEGGQGDSVANHICSKGVSKPVRIGAEDFTVQTVMAEQ